MDWHRACIEWRMALAKELARRIFSVLVEHCGARADSSGHGEFSFVHYLTEEHPFYEFRFMGSLGFGGKFYYSGDRFFVCCYPEDRTPERDAAIQKANEVLKELWDESF